MTQERQPLQPRIADPFGAALDEIDSLDLSPPVFRPLAHVHRATFEREMSEIKDNVLRMGSLVEAQIRAAIAGIVTHDDDACVVVIRGDADINELQRKVTSMIAATVATQAPVARDLRFLLTLDHVAYELERMGDHAASVAKQGRKLAPHPPLKQYVDLPLLGDKSAELVHGIIRALVDIDMVAARTVAAQDDEVDALYHRIFDDVLELMRQDADNVDRGARIMLAAHYLERIGDRVTNIAEDIVFLGSGEVEDLNP
jgi:phosphate transport system protein